MALNFLLELLFHLINRPFEEEKVIFTPGPTPVTSFEISDPNSSKSMYFRWIFAKIDRLQPRIARLTDIPQK